MRYRFATVGEDDREGSRRPGSERPLLALWALLVCLAVFFQLGSRAFFEPDEGRNAEVMREMKVSGDYLVPRLNSLLFLDKPFLYFAAGGLAMKAFGTNELAARLPGVLCTFVLGALVGGLARRWWGARAGQFAGLAAVAAPLPMLYSQIVIFDAMLALWMCVALAAFGLAVESEPAAGARSPAFWSTVAWAAMALGVLTKGPVALLVPLAGVLPWAFWRRRARRLVAGGAPLALARPDRALGVGGEPRRPGFPALRPGDRDLEPAEQQRAQARRAELVLPPDRAPGGAPLVGRAVRGRPAHRRRLARERELDPLPAALVRRPVPALLRDALEAGALHPAAGAGARPALDLALAGDAVKAGRLPGVRPAGALWLLLGAATLALGLGAAPKVLARVDGASPATVASTALALGAAWALAGLVALFSSRSLPRAFCALTLPPMALLLLSAPLADAVGERRSARQLAREIERDYPKGIEIVAVEAFPASLPFYLDRPLVMESVDGGPLRSNYILRRYPQMVDDAGPLRSPAWLAGAVLDCATPRTFVVRRRNEGVRKLLAAAGRPMHEGGRDFVLFGPCPPAGAASGIARAVLQALADEPPVELLPPAVGDGGRVPR